MLSVFSLVHLPHSLLLSFKNHLKKNFICMCACQHVCLCTTCVPSAHRIQKRTLFPLEPELQTAVDNHVGTGKGAWVHRKSNKRS